MGYFQTAADVFKPKSYIAFVVFFEVLLDDPCAVMMKPLERGSVLHVLVKMNKAGITVL